MHCRVGNKHDCQVRHCRQHCPCDINTDVDQDWMLSSYAHWMCRHMAYTGCPASILSVGLGANWMTACIQAHCPNSQLVIVELNEHVVIWAESFFDLVQGPQIKVVVSDALRYMQTTSETFNFVLVDCSDSDSVPEGCKSKEFYAAVRSVILKNGTFAQNIANTDQGDANVIQTRNNIVEVLQPLVTMFPPESH